MIPFSQNVKFSRNYVCHCEIKSEDPFKFVITKVKPVAPIFKKIVKGGGFTQNVITMEISIITTEDLSLFKKDLLNEIRELMQQQDSSPVKKYLKSSEVIKLLKISPGTLHNLRENGTLPYSKLGGLIFYEADKIARVLEEGKVSN